MVAAKHASLNQLRAIATAKSFAVICVLLFLMTGCGQKTDVTRDPTYGDFLVIVGTWKTKVPLKLVKYDEKLYLWTSAMWDINSYRHTIIATIPAGTEIRIDRLVLDRTFERDIYHPMGSFPSGPYAGDVFELDPELFAPNGFLLTDAARPPSKTWAVNADKLK